MKQCKRTLRKAYRQTEAKRRADNPEHIMASSGNDKEFYRLVRSHGKSKDSSLPSFMTVDNKILDTPNSICKGWAFYFQDLDTLANNDKYDDSVKEEYAEDTDRILKICTHKNQTIPPATYKEAHQAILRLKTNKATDYMDLTREHLKYGGPCVKTYPLNFVNHIFSFKRVPSVLKSGQITPVFKKAG